MNNVICHGRIALDDLRPLITQCHFSADARVLMEQLPQRIITRQADRQALLLFEFFDSDIKFEQYTSGRIFQEDGELRWEKEREQFRVVYVGIESKLSETVESLLRDYRQDKDQEQLPEVSVPYDTPPPKKYYLFGTRLEQDTLEKIGPVAKKGDFAEVRIQRLLRYPLKKESTKGPICFIVQELYDQKTGQLALFRFVGLDENNEKGDEKGKEGTEE